MLKAGQRGKDAREKQVTKPRKNAVAGEVVETQAPRRRGRPAKRSADDQSGQADISRQMIIEYATTLSREVALDEISIVRLAKELSVTPAAIHYHLSKGRDELISEVVTQYMRHLLSSFERMEGTWEERVRNVARRLFQVHIEFKGVNVYLMSHNKFRLLQTESKGEQDLGIKYLDRFIGIFVDAGFDIQTSVVYMHQLAFFIASCAQAEVRRQFPAFHEKYLRQEISGQRLAGAPHFAMALDVFVQFDAETMFGTGIELLIKGFGKPKRVFNDKAS